MRFVVVNGPPASGKSTLAVPLAQALGWPLFSKDLIKEALGDVLDLGGQAWTKTLSGASFDVLWAVAANCPEAVLEGNFYPGSAARLRSLDDRPVEIFCRCPIEQCRERFAERMAREERHPVHPPSLPSLEFFAQFAEPMAVGPVLEVATDRELDLESILAWINALG
jgi:predicted kinase